MKTAIILTHAAFDRPKVVNPIFRGPKKGCLNLGKLRRQLRATQHWEFHGSRQGDQAPANAIRPPCPDLEHLQELYQTADEKGADWILSSVEFAVQAEEKRRKGVAK
ncbi:hypothetical protein [Herbaspirillum rubrisubalbicans]|uniref:Uncharacterized protein n=1 Tax=Herbaspirillum rubrisubalbicans TaxID=80842 RepID=A0AAD0XEF0_9BURK|nr:hypothetical protein [Herbaspirillum rubrisubalbicans]AYR23001.1 hypothetical protein RC54_03830 [Herbaspirillum rubrisubalbicans]